MTAEEREAFYDAEIAPVLLDLAQRCKAEGLSFLAVVEYDLGKHGRTRKFADGKIGLGIASADWAAQACGNVDVLIMMLMKYAQGHGHSSLCLSQLWGSPDADPGRITCRPSSRNMTSLP